MFKQLMPSPLGELEITANSKAIISILFADRLEEQNVESLAQSSSLTELCAQQLNEYFSEHRTVFELPLEPVGTEFQQKVWRALEEIPFGETCSYADIANAINRPKAVRAVGAANGRNPLTIVVPCHRVIGKDGSLTGYAGGMDRKSWLLNLEQPSLF